MPIVPVKYLPHTMFFFTFWKEKCIKTGIMTNVGKNRLVKVIFTNISKISDARANNQSLEFE